MASLRQCVLLPAGFGPGDSGLPLLSDSGGRPLLAWALREFQRFGAEEFLLLTDTEPGALESAAIAVAAGLPRMARVTVVQVPAGLGSGGAVLHVRERLHEDFLLYQGDIAFDCNLAALLAAHQRHAAAGTLLLHGPGSSTDVAIGVCSRGMLQDLHSADSLQHGVWPRLYATGKVRKVTVDGWFCDLRDPAQLARAQCELPRRLHRPALLLDRDGVLNVDHGWVGTRDRFEWIAGALDTIRLATQSGWHVFVVTNQSGVARGLYDEAAVCTLLSWMADQAHAAGGTVDDWRYCPYHEDAVVERYRRTHHWRKPQPGMLLDLIRSWELDPTRCVMIGDQPTDMQAAAAAGVQGHLFPGGNLLHFVRPLITR